jgi:putative nucleotidyltransferase with HDIG domain
MKKQLLDLILCIEVTGDLHKDVFSLLSMDGNKELEEHTIKVAYEAERIARLYEISEEKAFTAGLLHDIGKLIPLHRRIDICDYFGVYVFEEERLVPSMLHPKLSRIIADNFFHVDAEICNAVECHSTLKANASKLDLVLFIADKVSWPRTHNGGFVKGMLDGLDVSLECSAIKFLQYIHSGHAEVLHPWAIEGYNYLKDICN